MVHRGLRLRLRESQDLFFVLICLFKPIVLEYLLKLCGTDRVLEIGELTIRQALAVQRPLHPLQEGWGLPQTREFFNSLVAKIDSVPACFLRALWMVW